MQSIQKKIPAKQAYLITNASNIQYLTNFTGSNGTVLLSKKHCFLFTDSRYARVATKVIPSSTKLIITSNLFEDLKKLLTKLKISVLNFESHHMTVQKYASFKKKLQPVQLKPSQGFIEQFRIIKSQKEVKYITKSQRINEQVFNKVVQDLKVGKTEKQVAWEIEKIGKDLGADTISFEPIIGFGNNSGSPHHMNTNRKLKKGDMVLIDMGMKYKGYCSDMTRTFFTKKPTPLQAKIYNIVLDAQVSAEKSLKKGMKCSDADKVARDIITQAGYGKLFGHSLGHGIGLDVHESPSLSTNHNKPLPEGTFVTVEPGIYLEKSFGVRIEDMVLMKGNNAVNITKTPKKIEDLIIRL